MVRALIAALATVLFAGIIVLSGLAGTPGPLLSSAPCAASVPQPACAAGYRANTFSNNGNFTTATVDLNQTYAPGFQLYIRNFGRALSGGYLALNPDHSLTITGGGGANGYLSTIAGIKATPYYVGNAFGGGLYVEAELKFDPTQVIHERGFPSFWTMPAEHELQGYNPVVLDQWPGQKTGYRHFDEIDQFEFSQGIKTRYGNNVIDWYGNSSCDHGNYCKVQTGVTATVASTLDWTSYNKIAMRWIPATPSTSGELSFWLNGALMNSLRYAQYNGEIDAPPPVSPWKYGVTDGHHAVFLLGNSLTAIAAPGMTLRSLNVWQKDASQNWTR